MQKIPFSTDKQKTRTALAVAARINRSKNKKTLYDRGKKIADKVINIFNYQYNDSDLEQFVF